MVYSTNDKPPKLVLIKGVRNAKPFLKIEKNLYVYDSDGKYISLYPDDDFAIVGVQCYIQNDEQRDQIMQMSIDDQVTLRGKCTSVGEVLGYSLDIDSIN